MPTARCQKAIQAGSSSKAIMLRPTAAPSVTDVPGYIKVMVELTVVPPGDRFVISTIINADELNDWGVVTDSMTVSPEQRLAKDNHRDSSDCQRRFFGNVG